MLCLFLSVILALGTASGVAVGHEITIAARQDCPDACSAFAPVEFYRAYAESVHDHFYTRNLSEIIKFEDVYAMEPSVGRVLSTSQGDAVPLFRLFNQGVSDHLYTVDPAERQELLTDNDGWVDEGIAGYILPQPQCGTIPFYRLFDDANDHFYTTDTAELVRAIVQFGYAYQSTVGYIWPL